MSDSMKKFSMTILTALVAVVLLANVASACPNCKGALGDPEAAAWGRGFSLSIYFMLATVHLLIGAAIYKVYRVVKAEDKRYADSDEKK